MNFNYEYITTTSSPSNNRYLYQNNFNLLKNFGNPTEPIPSSWPYICEPLPAPQNLYLNLRLYLRQNLRLNQRQNQRQNLRQNLKFYQII
jgi:hypothetical protein